MTRGRTTGVWQMYYGLFAFSEEPELFSIINHLRSSSGGYYENRLLRSSSNGMFLSMVALIQIDGS